MLRDRQHERKIMNGLKSAPFVLSQSKHAELFFSNQRLSDSAAFDVHKVRSSS
jgi:hypothetical protein